MRQLLALEAASQKTPQRLLTDNVLTMIEQDDSTILIAAGGLNMYDKKKRVVRHLTLSDGLPAEMIMSMEKDRSGIYGWDYITGSAGRANGMFNDHFGGGGSSHHEINVTLNNIYMLSEMARIKADNNVPLSKEYIGQIHNKSRDMIMTMDDILWSIKPENDSMEKFFWRMRELTEGLKNGNRAAIEINISGKVKELDLEMKHRLLFFLIFKEALHTVILNAKGRKTKIDIDLVQGDLSFRLQDDTVFFDMDQKDITKSIQSMKDRAEQLDADLDILADGKSITIILLSPVK